MEKNVENIGVCRKNVVPLSMKNTLYMTDNILQNIFQSLSNRELASMTLIGLLSLYFILFKSDRKSTYQVIKTILSPKILIPYSLLSLCIIAMCYMLQLVGMWRNEYLKDVILYSFTAFPLLMEVISYSSQQEFGQLVFKQVKYSALISAYLNIYTLGYIGELLLQFVLCFLSLSVAIVQVQSKQDQSSEQLLGCFNKVNMILGFAIIIFMLYQTYTHPIGSTLSMFLQSVALPTILTITIVPYLYMFTIYCAYDQWFVRLYYSVNKNKNEYRLRKKMLFHTCKINLHKIRYFEEHLKLFMFDSSQDFIFAIQQCDLEYQNIGKY